MKDISSTGSFIDFTLENFIYVDKTEYIPKLVKLKRVFISRPRRFGKSLTLDMALPLREQKLFERLKWWRMEVARQQNLPAYVILQDSALREIVIAKPETADELLQISGIGSKRLSMWGEDILRLVSEFIFSSV